MFSVCLPRSKSKLSLVSKLRPQALVHRWCIAGAHEFSLTRRTGRAPAAPSAASAGRKGDGRGCHHLRSKNDVFLFVEYRCCRK